MKHYGDITKIQGNSVPPVDCLTGGSPCQDLSVAGKRAGLAGERSGLFMEQIRIVKEMRERDRQSDGYFRLHPRPRYMVWENVPGAFSSNKGRDFQAVLTEIVRIKEPGCSDVPMPEKDKWPAAGFIYDELGGWSIAWRVHDAQWWGVPQRRKRIALVADFDGLTAGAVVFGNQLRGETARTSPDEAVGDSGNEPRPQIQPLGARMSENPQMGTAQREETAGATGKSTGRSGGTIGVGNRGTDGGNVAETAYTLKARGGVEIDSYGKRAGKGALVQTELSGTLGVSQDQTLIQIPKDRSVFTVYNGESVTSPLNKSNPKPGDPCHSLTTDSRNYLIEDEPPKCLNPWDIQMKRIQPEDGVADALCSAEKRYGGGESLVFDASRTTFGVGDPGDPEYTISAAHSHAVFTMNPRPQSMCTSENLAATLGADDYKEPQMVYDARGNGDGSVVPTLTGDHQNRVSDYTAITCQRVTGPLMASGYAKNGTQEMANGMYVMQGFGDYKDSDTASACKARDYKDATDLVCAIDCRNGTESTDTNGTLQAKPNGGQSLNYNNVCRTGATVRRLTPKERERLQGYPDDWTDIGEYIDTKGKTKKTTDSARYKALGNSIALPFWFYLLRRISAQYERPATLGSLFDGIGGFPLCWERCNGPGTALWASEIEEFPIAVTKRHFPE